MDYVLRIIGTYLGGFFENLRIVLWANYILSRKKKCNSAPEHAGLNLAHPTCHSTKKTILGIFKFHFHSRVTAPLVLPYITYREAC